MLPVVEPQPLRPDDPQNAEFWEEPLPLESSFFAFVLPRTPALKKCLPKTAE